MQLTNASNTVFMLAAMEAEAIGSAVIDSEHLFLGLLKSEDVFSLGDGDFMNLGAAEVKEVKEEIGRFVSSLKESRIECRTARRRLRRLVKDSQNEVGEFTRHRSPRCREAFGMAEQIARKEAKEGISIIHLAQAVLRQESQAISAFLAEAGISRDTLLSRLANTQAGPVAQSDGQDTSAVRENLSRKFPFLSRFGRELVSLARDGRIDPVIGRAEEIKRVAQILTQKKKSNPILVGDAGVGKTCVVEGLALKCAHPKAPPALNELHIFDISMGALIAGTKYRGEFEERLENMVKEASSDPRTVLFIDEIHTMVGAGAGAEGAMNAANILKPALARGLIKCIGATTTAEYRRFIEKDAALERRFQVVWVEEPTREETAAILRGLKPRFEEHHGITITDKAIEAAVDLSVRYLMDAKLPDKAVDLIDQACAQSMLRTLSFTGGASVTAIHEIGFEEVARVVSQRARIPLDNLMVDDSRRYVAMEEALHKRVKGQDDAVREVAEAVRAAKAGLKDPRRPIGVFLFLGSTGIGKTELAKALAEFLFFDESRLIRIDMSEYQEKHSIARLLGAPPGYVGYEEEGQLVRQVRTNPYAVVLFDEIEKAHPDIFDIFLQIFDEGMLTDAKGRRVNFRESIIIMTSNLGSLAAAQAQRPMGIAVGKSTTAGFVGSKSSAVDDDTTRLPEPIVKRDVPERYNEYRQRILTAVSQALRPELLNRIQKKIMFYPLGPDTVRDIIQKVLDGINQRLSPKGNRITLAAGVEAFLMQEGYSEKDGVRQMERVMEQHIVQPLSKEILEGRIPKGVAIEVDMSEFEDSLTFKTFEHGV